MSAPPAPTHEKRSDFVQSLERGLSVIRAFGAGRRELILSEVARTAGLSRAAARRFLLTLVQLGYADSTDGRFSLRPRVLELGHCFLSGVLMAADGSHAIVDAGLQDRGGQIAGGSLRAVAVPIRDRSGSPVATLSLIDPSGRFSAESLERACLPALQDTATAIERKLHPPAQ
jgi:DNA-binding IclR family transcriptional regulator